MEDYTDTLLELSQQANEWKLGVNLNVNILPDDWQSDSEYTHEDVECYGFWSTEDDIESSLQFLSTLLFDLSLTHYILGVEYDSYSLDAGNNYLNVQMVIAPCDGLQTKIEADTIAASVGLLMNNAKQRTEEHTK